MTNELKAEAEARISKAEAQMAICDRNTADGSNFYNHFKGVADFARKQLDDLKQKPKVNLHVAGDSMCESCEG